MTEPSPTDGGRRTPGHGRRRGGPSSNQGRRGPASARSVALEVLTAVREQDAYANLVLPALLRSARLPTRDAALATELTYGTLRMQGFLDAVIAAAAGRPIEAMDGIAVDLARLGAYQVLYLRVPTHAAVSETVALARRRTHSGVAGLVNAVLRRVTEADRAGWLDRVTQGLDATDRLVVEHSHPRWIVESFAAALQANARPDSDLVDLLTADNAPAAVTLAARPGLGAEPALADAGAMPGRFAPTAWRLSHGDPGDLAAIADGSAAVQDEGSQLVALALGAAPIEGADERWLDLCAGPGGKAGLLGALAGLRGAKLLAVESSAHRAELVRTSVRRLADAVTVREADGRSIGAEQPGEFDRVLLDAPCSGLGALRRRPEARWRRTPRDLPGLVTLQQELLDSAIAALRPGGLLAYVTCSPHLAETAAQVGGYADTAGGLVAVDARPYLPGVPELGPGPAVQLWPHVHDTDAMFLALFRRL
jgi:16S rRNA (cytosine967-C5)-methyltransferase